MPNPVVPQSELEQRETYKNSKCGNYNPVGCSKIRRLGGTLPGTDSRGSVEQGGSTTPHKCLRNESIQIGDRVVLQDKKTKISSPTNRQRHSLSHLVKMGGTKGAELNKISKEIWEYLIVNEITLTAKYLPSSQNIQVDWESRHTKNSSECKLCPQVFAKTTQIMRKPHVDLFASRLSHQLRRYMSWKLDPYGGSECPATKMDTYVPLWFSPIFSNRERFKENPRGQSYCNSYYPNMAVANLVPLDFENEDKKSDLTSKQKHLSDEPSRINSPAHRIGELKTSSLVNFKQRMEAEEISEKAVKLITNARSVGTQARYESAWNNWVSWCTQRQIDPFRCSVKFVTNFVADLFETGLEYRTLNSYRSTISAFHDNGDSVPAGRHPLVPLL